MRPWDTTDPNGKIDALDVLPPQVRLPMLEDCLDAGLKYSSELAALTELSVQENIDDVDDDAEADAFGKKNLDQWIKEAIEYNDPNIAELHGHG